MQIVEASLRAKCKEIGYSFDKVSAYLGLDKNSIHGVYELDMEQAELLLRLFDANEVLQMLFNRQSVIGSLITMRKWSCGTY